MIKRTILLCGSLFCLINLYSQDFNVEQQYKQAMENAKQSFNAGQFSQAVMFYREALSIKPDELLPRYKVEDIRTIYIKNELDSLIQNQIVETDKKRKKEREAEKQQLQEKAEEIATAKMNQETEKIIEELKEISRIPEAIVIDDSVDIEDNIVIENIEPDRQIPLAEVKSHSVHELKTNNKDQLTILKENRKAPPVIETKEESKPVTKTIVNKPFAKPQVTKEWIEQENGRLAAKYPNIKTIEEIEKTGKLITKVIMNIDHKVTVYLKVKHNWGATFYFIDEVGLEPSSISEIHFNRMTDLSTYSND